MKIEKILNNNVAVILDDKGSEAVVMGRGISFQRKCGDFIDQTKIDKIFTLTGKDMSLKFQELLIDMPMEHILISEKIITYAKTKLSRRLSDSIYITLTDHISTVIDRYKDDIKMKNALLWDIRQFYPEEFGVGAEAVKMIQESHGAYLPEDEAAFIAMHFVNAQMQGDDEGMTLVHFMTKLIQEITNIVKYSLKLSFNSDSLAYYRFINHLKYFAQRLFNHEDYNEGDTDILQVIKAQNAEAYKCTMTIASFIKNQYAYDLGEEEMLYMTIHIARIAKEAG